MVAGAGYPEYYYTAPENGIEHIAVDTDDYAGTLAKFRANGVRVLEELPPTTGRRVGFVEAPDGAQIEVIERV